MSSLVHNWPAQKIHAIVVTDGSRMLGLGDLGVNGLCISIGKLDIYCAGAGFHPSRVMPVVIDVGTNNEQLLNHPLYFGLRRQRLEGDAYYELIDEFMRAVLARYPNVLIQFEDFSTNHAQALLDRYRDHHLVFNDDIQGTATTVRPFFRNASIPPPRLTPSLLYLYLYLYLLSRCVCVCVWCEIGAQVLGGIYGALAVKGLSASALASQQFVVCGAGSAGMGVVSFLAKAMSKHGITEEEARQRFWILDVDGLITSGRDGHVPDFVRPFARMDAELEGADLLSVIQHAKPTVLIGASTVGGLFTSDHLGEMTKHCDRPLVMALSNPTSKLECTSEQCAAWTKGRGIYAAGSPQPDCVYDGKEVASSQANNMYIFPGLALGASVGKAKVITDAMLMKASESLVDCITAEELERGSIYPKLGSIREISLEIACSVIEQAVRDGVTKAESRAVEVLAEQGREGLRGFVRSRMFIPSYDPLVYVPPGIGE